MKIRFFSFHNELISYIFLVISNFKKAYIKFMRTNLFTLGFFFSAKCKKFDD